MCISFPFSWRASSRAGSRPGRAGSSPCMPCSAGTCTRAGPCPRDQLCAAGLCPAEGERRALLGADTLAPFFCPCVHPPKTGLGQKRVNAFTHRGVSAGTATPAVGPATCLRTELSAGRSREAGAELVSLAHRAQGGGVGLAHSETRGE